MTPEHPHEPGPTHDAGTAALDGAIAATGPSPTHHPHHGDPTAPGPQGPDDPAPRPDGRGLEGRTETWSGRDHSAPGWAPVSGGVGVVDHALLLDHGPPGSPYHTIVGEGIEKEPKIEAAAKALVGVHSHTSGQRAWRAWCTKELKIRDSSNDQMDFDDVEQLDSICLPTQSEFGSLRKNFVPAVLNHCKTFVEAIDQAGGTSLRDLAQHHDFKDSLELAEWLDGKWLEHYTLAQIRACADRAHLNPNGMGINLKPKNQEKREFEADVLALRGYQLFFFSCYSGSSYKTAKLKLFEAMIRATQLGGDETLVALVSCVDKMDDLRREAEANWQATGRIRVFGRQDLPCLASELEKWFNHARHTIRS